VRGHDTFLGAVASLDLCSEPIPSKCKTEDLWTRKFLVRIRALPSWCKGVPAVRENQRRFVRARLVRARLVF